MPSRSGPGTWGEITAEVVRSVEFPRLGLGYRAADVDAFLHLVAAALAEAETERAALRAELHRLRYWYRRQGERLDPPEPRAPVEAPPPQAWQARVMAQQASWDLAAAAGAPPFADPGEPVRLAEWSRAFGEAVESHLRAVTEAFAFEAARLANVPPADTAHTGGRRGAAGSGHGDPAPGDRPGRAPGQPASPAAGPWLP